MLRDELLATLERLGSIPDAQSLFPNQNQELISLLSALSSRDVLIYLIRRFLNSLPLQQSLGS